jgi:integrase/recombinase XerD
MSPPDLPALLESYELSLRAERKSPATVKAYTTGVLQYLAWCGEADAPAVLDRRQVARFADALLTRGVQPATARS